MPPECSSSRPRSLAAVLALALVLGLGACGGGGADPAATGDSSTTSSSTTATSPSSPERTGSTEGDGDAGGAPAGASSGPCADVAVTVFEPVVGPDEEAEVPGEDEYVAALGRLADSDQDEVAGPAGEIEAAMDEGEDLSDDDGAAALAAMDRLLAWGAANCPLDGPVWGCVQRSGFTPVGPAITEDGAIPPAGDAATPEAAVASGTEPEGQRIELSRTDEEVVFAWSDARGVVVATMAVENGPDGWAKGTTTTCDDPSDDDPSDDEFEMVGGPVEG